MNTTVWIIILYLKLYGKILLFEKEIKNYKGQYKEIDKLWKKFIRDKEIFL